MLVFGENNNIIFCGNRLHLSKNEYDVLSLLDNNLGEPVSREKINHILGGECGNMCDVYICRLRAKLADLCKEKLIYTVRNLGPYIFGAYGLWRFVTTTLADPTLNSYSFFFQ